LNSKPKTQNLKLWKLVLLLLDWFSKNARDLPWRRTRDPYAIWVSEIMLQQTQVKTVIPFWERWMRALPTIEAVAKAPSAKIHKLWEGLGYYTRVRNLQKAAQQIVTQQTPRRRRGDESQTKNELETPHVISYRFPETFEEVLALPGIGRYTAGAICSIAFNQPLPILDGNVIRVLTRIFGITENPKEKQTNARLWQLAEELVLRASSIQHPTSNSRTRMRSRAGDDSVSHLNQSLMELGALICTPRNPQCSICPVKKHCIAFKEVRIEQLPNLGKREKATARAFFAFAIERDGKFLVQRRPAGIVNAHLWEFPNFEINGREKDAKEIFDSAFDFNALEFQPLCTIKHSITRYRITLKAFHVNLGGRSSTTAKSNSKSRGVQPSEKWLAPSQFDLLAFTAAHKKLASFATNCILSGR
jgi:A/G-specific adenine glycosylase